MRTVAVIPARMGSSRFPGKPLARIGRLTMVEHVYRRTALCPAVSATYVATCDEEIRSLVEGFGGCAIMTSPQHERASDRIAEAARSLEAEVILMVQGDEPMITPDMIQEALAPFQRDPTVVCVNLAARIETMEDFEDRNTIKVVMAENGDALYLSRAPIPSSARTSFGQAPAYKQVCVIPFRKDFLLRFAALLPTPLEQAESIDMLRALEHGYRVRMVRTSRATQAVDTPEDLALVEAMMRQDALVGAYGGRG